MRRYGTDAALVLDRAREVTGLDDDELLAPVADGVAVTLAELVFGVTDEGAHDVGDLLDRRTRVGLVPADRARCVAAAERALDLARAHGAVTAPTRDESGARRRSAPAGTLTDHQEQRMTTRMSTARPPSRPSGRPTP